MVKSFILIGVLALLSFLVSSCSVVPTESSFSSGKASAAVNTKYDTTGYNLVWADEFSGSSLDTSKWNIEVGVGRPITGNNDYANANGGWPWGNGEVQTFTDRPQNIFLSNGCLYVRAIKEDYQSTYTVGGMTENAAMHFTSGRINTKGKFDFKYGKLVASMKLPNMGRYTSGTDSATGSGTCSKGVWPCFWLLGANQDAVGWPACGEIDILEGGWVLYGGGNWTVWQTIHWYKSGMQTWGIPNHAQWPNDEAGWEYEPGLGKVRDERKGMWISRPNNDIQSSSVEPLYSNFHDYEMEWTDSNFIMRVDGILTAQYGIALDQNMGAFQSNFYILISLALGGDCTGANINNWNNVTLDSDPIKNSIICDYIRVYQKGVAASSTGTGGGSSTPASSQAASSTPASSTAASSQAASSTGGSGFQWVTMNGTTATIHVNTNATTIYVHYGKNGQSTTANNYTMSGTSPNFTQDITGMNSGDYITYYFTIQAGSQYDTGNYTYTVGAAGSSTPASSTPASSTPASSTAASSQAASSTGGGGGGFQSATFSGGVVTITATTNGTSGMQIHYGVNATAGSTWNGAMSGSSPYTKTISCNSGDVINYYFTVQLSGGGQYDTGNYSYTAGSGGGSSTPASSQAASSTPASSTPASSTPASSQAASSTGGGGAINIAGTVDGTGFTLAAGANKSYTVNPTTSSKFKVIVTCSGSQAQSQLINVTLNGVTSGDNAVGPNSVATFYFNDVLTANVTKTLSVNAKAGNTAAIATVEVQTW